MAEDLELIVETLRGRVIRLIQSGTLSPGDRLPSARTLAKEFGVDFRTILNAYRVLADERLIQLKPRGGVYIAPQTADNNGKPPIPALWIGDLLAQALTRNIPPAEFHELIRRCTETLRLRAVVIAPTEDQAFGLRRELAEDFGLEAETVNQSSIGTSPLPVSLRRSDLLVTVDAIINQVRELGVSLGVPVLQVRMRPDFLKGEWALLLRQPVYAVVATEEFGQLLRKFFSDQPGVENLHIVVHGRDDLRLIPHGAQTYITQRVRASLSADDLQGNILPPARTISSASAREIFAFIVEANVAAMESRRNPEKHL